MEENIINRPIQTEMKNSFIDYSMSVISSRALPDARDGLKPVHRRILYSMKESGITYEKGFKKSARVVGDVLGKYHPHGDSAVYESMVRMEQPFSLRYPLVDGQGNFGSIDGDSAAAMRYCLNSSTMLLTDKGILPIGDIENENIDMNILSYDGKINHASKFFNSGKHDIIEIETNMGYKLSGTHNHPVLCWNLKNNIPQIEWKLLENIKENDIVILNRNESLFASEDLSLTKYHSNKGKIKFDLPNKMTNDLAFLLGALVSEGSFHQGKIIFNNSDINYYNKIKNILFNLFNGITIYESENKNCYQMEIYHANVINFLKNIGLKETISNGVIIPFTILQSSKEIVTTFLQALFEGDGSISFSVDKRNNGKTMMLTYCSNSVKLIEQLKIILLNYGIISTYPKKDKRCECYKLVISGYENIKIFNDEINFYSKRKSEILNNINILNPNRMSKTDYIPYISDYIRNKYNNNFLKKNNFDRYNKLNQNYNKIIEIIDENDKNLINFLIKNHYLFNKITKITKKPPETVYSIKVDSNCHSFVANGFINHNTEAKLSKISNEMLEDIDKNTVKFTPNYDASLEEPSVLPSKLPNLLINGSTGIAVGMATNMPPHNLNEIVDGILATIDNPDITTNELMHYIKAPDFPTAGTIVGMKGVKSAYETGRGIVKIRGVSNIEEMGNGKNRIVITEIPYQVNKSKLIENIALLVKTKEIEGVSALRDESDRNGIRVVIELTRNTNPEIILNNLYKNTSLEVSFGIINLALVDGIPKELSLKELIKIYLNHRLEIILKRSQHDLDKSEAKIHILNGLMIALDNINDVITTIRSLNDVSEIKNQLMNRYNIDEIQVRAILDMKLQKLSGLEKQKIIDEHNELKEFVIRLNEIILNDDKKYDIIKEELIEIKNNFGDKRRTKIVNKYIEMEDENLIPEEDIVITMTNQGYIKRLPLTTYRQQSRGGKGVMGFDTKEEDFVENLYVTTTHATILFFTNSGKILRKKAYEIPEGSRTSKGKAIVNLLNLQNEENITTLIPVKEFDEDKYLFMVTEQANTKKCSLSEFNHIRKTGIVAINLENDDKLVNVLLTDGNQEIVMVSKYGKAIRYHENDIRSVGRTAKGVRGMKLANGDHVVSLDIVDDTCELLTITENGFGKRTSYDEYHGTRRGGSGVITIKTSLRNGYITSVKSVNDNDDIIITTSNGIMIRIPASDIRVQGRNTQGVKIIELKSDDKVMSVARIQNED